jgi:hypothetical protein
MINLYAFQNFLLRVASHPILSFDQQFIAFLQQDESWRENIKDAGKLPQFLKVEKRCYVYTWPWA